MNRRTPALISMAFVATLAGAGQLRADQASGTLSVDRVPIEGPLRARVEWEWSVSGFLEQRVRVLPSSEPPEKCTSVSLQVEVDVYDGSRRLGVLREKFWPVKFGQHGGANSRDYNIFDGDDVDGASDDEVKEARKKGSLTFSNLRATVDRTFGDCTPEPPKNEDEPATQRGETASDPGEAEDEDDEAPGSAGSGDGGETATDASSADGGASTPREDASDEDAEASDSSGGGSSSGGRSSSKAASSSGGSSASGGAANAARVARQGRAARESAVRRSEELSQNFDTAFGPLRSQLAKDAGDIDFRVMLPLYAFSFGTTGIATLGITRCALKADCATFSTVAGVVGIPLYGSIGTAIYVKTVGTADYAKGRLAHAKTRAGKLASACEDGRDAACVEHAVLNAKLADVGESSWDREVSSGLLGPGYRPGAWGEAWRGPRFQGTILASMRVLRYTGELPSADEPLGPFPPLPETPLENAPNRTFLGQIIGRSGWFRYHAAYGIGAFPDARTYVPIHEFTPGVGFQAYQGILSPYADLSLRLSMPGHGAALPEGATDTFPLVTVGNTMTFSGLFGKRLGGSGVTRLSLAIDTSYVQPIGTNYRGGFQVGIGAVFMDPYRW